MNLGENYAQQRYKNSKKKRDSTAPHIMGNDFGNEILQSNDEEYLDPY